MIFKTIKILPLLLVLAKGRQHTQTHQQVISKRFNPVTFITVL